MNLKYFPIVCIWFAVSHCTPPPPEKHSDNKVVYDAALTDTFFLKNGWSYPLFTDKDEKGQFFFASDTHDTTHLQHTANFVYAFDSAYDNAAYFQQKRVWEKVRYGAAHLLGNTTLILTFDDSTPSSYNNLKIKIKNGYWTSIYLSGSPAGGNRYYDFEESSLILQKETVAVGDTLRGYLDCKVRKPHYCHLKGAFKVKVLKNDL